MTDTRAGVPLSEAMLSEYNFQVLIDASGSMGEFWNGKTRWEQAGVIAKEIADFAARVDDDGIDVVCFGGRFDATKDAFTKVSSDKVYEIFSGRRPSGSTPLAQALQIAVDTHFTSSKKSFVVVITDGLPDDKEAALQVIVNASKRLVDDTQLTFLFLQIGQDIDATRFLQGLDDDLLRHGSAFDIVDRKIESEWRDVPFATLFSEAQSG